MITISSNQFILVTLGNKIDTVFDSWFDLQEYCAETGKRGTVYLVETKIPLGGLLDQVTTTTAIFAEIE